MEKNASALGAVALAALAALSSCVAGNLPVDPGAAGRVADHTVVDQLRLGSLAESRVRRAKDELRIGYGHTSHGSQITDGMNGLIAFANAGKLGTAYSQDLFAWNDTGTGGALQLHEGDGYGSGDLDHDAGYYPAWVNETRAFLDDPDNAAYNVVMWS